MGAIFINLVLLDWVMYVHKPFTVLKNRKRINIKPGTFYNKPIKLDSTGFFLIKINQKTKKIHVGFCTYQYNVTHEFISTSGFDLMKYIIKHGFVTDLDHAAYLGFQLQKAFNAIKNHKDYVQD